MQRIPRTQLIAALGVLLLTLAQLRFAQDAAFPQLGVSTDGVFPESGSLPGNSRALEGVRYWSSWHNDDAHRGELRIGPFPAPRVLAVSLCGSPEVGNNRIYLENTVTGEQFDASVPESREPWRRWWLRPPASWSGAPITLCVVDDAEAPGGWLAISEPRGVPWWATWWDGILPPLNTMLLSGLTLALTGTASAVLLCRWLGVRSSGLLLIAGACVSALGYFTFWCYLAHPIAGHVVADLLLVSSAGVCFGIHRNAAADLWRSRDWLVPSGLVVAAVIFYFGLLCLNSTDRMVAGLAANRYVENLPADNDIPHFFAERLRHARALRPFFGDWLSSDRPPLQVGWDLLLQPHERLTGISRSDADHLTAFWFQALWIPAVWWWLRSVRARIPVAAAVVAAVIPSGFYVVNAVFVWPKLGAAALAIGAFTAWFITRARDRAPATRFALGGGLAALAWLAHGGVAFSLVAAAPLAIFHWNRKRLTHWLAAAAVFLFLAAPWMAYQKFYDPPGNRLLKWHLAGVAAPDERGTLETLATSYRNATWTGLFQARWRNVQQIFHGPWRELFAFRPVPTRRDAEFFYIFFAFGWWNLGFAALLLIGIARIRRPGLPAHERAVAATLAWLGLTLVVWVALMFQDWSAVIHQGSYVVPGLLLPLLALALWRLHWECLFVVITAQVWTFPALWMRPPPGMASLPLQHDAMAVVLVAAAVLMCIVCWPCLDGARLRGRT